MRCVAIVPVCMLLLGFACVTAPKAPATFTGVDTFGSVRLTETIIQDKYGAKINELGAIDEANFNEFFRIKGNIENAIKKDFGLVYVRLSTVTYFAPNPVRYLTVDAVETQDVSVRMPFLPAPTGRYSDPDGLIALWDEYQNLGFSLLKMGQVRPQLGCPVWHCVFGFDHPQLAPYLQRFRTLVSPNESKLAIILKDDFRASYRGNAAFLLAHLNDGAAIVQYMLPAIFDSAEEARNNAVRVLFVISQGHPEVSIPIDPPMKALRFPATTDRNKASLVLQYLSLKEENRKPILMGVGWVLFDMLKLKQPNNHDPAYATLKNLSGESFGERDYSRWETWLRSTIGTRDPTL